jgi:hypothetical protein
MLSPRFIRENCTEVKQGGTWHDSLPGGIAQIAIGGLPFVGQALGGVRGCRRGTAEHRPYKSQDSVACVTVVKVAE